MPANSGCKSRLELACEPSATRCAVGHAKDVLRGWHASRDVTGDAVLIVDELVTNAVRHAGGAAGPFDPERGQPRVRRCTLELSIVSGSLVLCVLDASTRPPVLRGASPDAESGRGLLLVDGLSEGDWGYLPYAAGKRVWARLLLTQVRSERGELTPPTTAPSLRTA